MLDAAAFQLLRASQPVRIERLPLELLLLLVERPGELVSRTEIAARLWNDANEVDVESGIHTAVRKLRAALEDSAERPTLIETVPGKGYRFVGSVSQTLTIAVLPFEDLSGGAAHEHVADGLTEETIGALGAIAPDNVRVIARTSSMAYKRTGKTVEQIGRELGAAYLVEGSLRRHGERLRVAAKLVRARDQVQIWGEVYDRPVDDLIAVQEELGAAIARAVGAQTSPRPPRRPRHDPDAHDLLLRGRWYWQQRSADAMTKAEQCFLAAIEKSPSFAPAHAALADTRVLQILVNGADALERSQQARHAADEALRLDPDLAEAHAAVGMIDFYVGWDWDSAERSFLRAIELNPNYAIAHQFYGHLLSNSLRHSEAIAEIGKARAIDPLAPVMHAFAAMFFGWSGRYEEAFGAAHRALAIDRDHFPAHAVLGHLHDLTGNPDAAVEAYRQAHRLSRGNVMQLAFQGSVLARSGRTGNARQIVETIEDIARSRFVPPSAFALVFAGLDDRDAAFLYLDKAYELRDIFLVMLTCAHWWDPLREDPRFERLLRRCGFPRPAKP